MAKWGKGILMLLPVLLGMGLKAQNLSNLRYKYIPAATDTVNLDSLSIVPGSFTANTLGGVKIDSADYELQPFKSLLIWKNRPAGDSVRIMYRVYPFALGGDRYNKSYAEYLKYQHSAAISPFTYRPEESPQKLIDFGTLDYNGNFSRGLSFGSNQSVVLNSQFNLQLSGMLTRDLELTAAITDNNVPVQPEGNTQVIQEFDKIFIQLRKDRHKVIVGDFDLFNQPTYFMRFSKKYQGGYYSGSFDVKKKYAFRAQASGGISRGKFARNTLTVSEGNQGPYKLAGANGERFIVILANSEEVFINGQKMERGADRDYVIDYNLGEVVFTPRRIITKDLRVVVEFEYSERYFLRSAAFGNFEFDSKKASLRFNVFSEQDGKGQSVQQNLDDAKRQFLTNVGDSIQNALYRGWDSIAFDPNRIMYRMVDTLVVVAPGTPFTFDSVFVYSTDSTQAKYSVNFSEVGQGNGNYVSATSTANGRVFQWVSPLFDSVANKFVLQGNYEPLILLVTPKYEQMYTLAADYRINKYNTLTTEVAMSNKDLNMFGNKDNGDNIGFAGRVNYKGDIPFKKDSTGIVEGINLESNYEFVQDRFRVIERYRNVEFNRDWNIGNTQTVVASNNEHLLTATASYNKRDVGNVGYRFKAYVQDTVYKGFDNSIFANVTKKDWQVVMLTTYLTSKSFINSSNFVRPKLDVSYGFKKIKGWRLGAVIDHEVNAIKNKGEDTLNVNSYLWQNYKVYFKTPDSLINKFSIEFVQRYEHKAKGNGFDKYKFGAQTVNFTGSVNSIKNQNLNFTLTYRHADDKDSINSGSFVQNYYLGRIDYNFTVLKGFIKSSTLYELGSGREQKSQVLYQVSPTNQGDYIWKDLNEDGVKQIDEFVISQFKEDTSYFRVITVTPEFVPVNSTQFNQVLNINPASLWKNKKGALKVLSMFSAFASVQISKKTFTSQSKGMGNYFNPFPLKKEADQIVSTALSSRNSLFFNKLDPKYGAQVDFNYTQGKNLLTSGIESREQQSYGILLRWNIVKSLNIQANYTRGFKSNKSDFLRNLQYKYTYNDAKLELIYQLKSTVRFSVKYEPSYKVNPNDSVGNQTALSHQISLETRYNRLNKSTLEVKLSYASINYNDKGYANQQLQYAMLEGLFGGNNLVWGVTFDQKLGNNLVLTLAYDGRMTGFIKGDKSTINPVHTGRAELRAIF
jgi:hypothetical protein